MNKARIFSTTRDEEVIGFGESGGETRADVDAATSPLHSLAVPANDDQNLDEENDRIPFEDELDDDNEEGTEPDQIVEGMFDISKTSALATLNTYYSNEYGHASVRKHFRTEELNRMWFATFVCPETGTQYPQGCLRSDELMSAVEISSVTGEYIRGRPGYQKKSAAIQAAAARVLDMIQYQKLHIKEPRLCKEDPALFGRDSYSVLVTEASPDFAVDSSTARPIASECTMYKYEEVKSRKEINANDFVSQPDGEDDEYLVEYIPTPSGEYEPSKRLLQAFASRQEDHTPLVAMADSNSHRMPIAMGPLQRLKLAVEIAQSWAQANARSKDAAANNLHRLHLPVTPSAKTLLIGKTLLDSLAEANQSAAVSSGWVGCEKAALQIIDVLWENRLEDSRPDAEVYNLLLKCLEGSNQRAIAEKAETIVGAMQSGTPWRGRTLPNPNMDTINTLIQIWAQVGGNSGRYEKLPANFVPNRSSFLSILSSCCYLSETRGEPAGLDVEFASQCIRRMRELSEANPHDLSLVPDVQVYNAPLRWAGGSFARQSRPYARSIPWDTFYQFYSEEGLRPFDKTDARVIAAQNVERWIDIMREDEVQPDIETYESLMQAWLRTGTQVGLDRAQSIATDLIKGVYKDVIPRLQTFRPLTVCWLFSRAKEADQKIKDTINLLEKASTRNPELRPDTRLYTIVVAAYKNKIRNRLATKEDASVEELLPLAEACTAILDSLHRQLRTDIANGEATEIFFEVINFVDAMDAWQYVAAACLEGNQTDDKKEHVRRALAERVRVLDQYESLVQYILREESSEGVGLRLRREFSFQLKHLIDKSGALYSSFILGTKFLQGLASQIKHQDNLTVLFDSLPIFERIVRRSGEMEVAAFHDLKLRKERLYFVDADVTQGPDPRAAQALLGTVEYSDYFRGYRMRRQNMEATSRRVLLEQLLDCLRGIDIDKASRGDYARLLQLIKSSAKDEDMQPDIVCQATADKLLNRITKNHFSKTKHPKQRNFYEPRSVKGRRRTRPLRSQGSVKAVSPLKPTEMIQARE